MNEKKKNNYFGKEVDDALKEMKQADTVDKRNRVFTYKIMPAFEKLISYHYYRTPIAKNPEIQYDCMADLFEKVGKFDENKFDRGFPYFNMIVRNFFIQQLKSEKKQIENDQYSVSLTDYQRNQGKLDEHPVEDVDEQVESREFIEFFKENLYKWENHFQKEQEKKVASALITLFENAENIDIYNKKAIYWYLREITGLNSKQVATNLDKIKRKFAIMKKRYLRGDF